MSLLTAALLLASPAVGVLIFYVVDKLAQNPLLIRGLGNAVAVGCMAYAAWEVLQEASNPTLAPEALYGVVIGTLVVALAAYCSRRGGKGVVVVVTMALHTAAEGAAIGLVTDPATYRTVVTSLVLHNIPEGLVVAAAVVNQGGWFHAVMSAVMTHVPQVTFLSFSSWYQPSETTTLYLLGMSAGSILATSGLELLPDALEEIGAVKTVIAAGLSAWLMSLTHM
jgi:zinc transporter ZupT